MGKVADNMGKNYWLTQVAVSAVIWRGEPGEEETLFLHRVEPPHIWVPPGGRVEGGETPLAALLREVREETGLEHIRVLAPFIVEAGQHHHQDILFVDYVCQCEEIDITLEPAEHDAWRWLRWEALRGAEVRQSRAPGGETLYHYRMGGEELILSHSLQQLALSRHIRHCLGDERVPR